MFQYLARAKIEFGIEGINQPCLDILDIDVEETLRRILSDDEPFKHETRIPDKHETRIPELLPVTFGPFTIDKSPNEATYDKLQHGLIGKLEADLEKDAAFPVSILYVDACVKTEEKEADKRYILAERLFGQLEALMQVFQEGDIHIGLHALWKSEDGKLVEDDTLALATDRVDDMDDMFVSNAFTLQQEPINLYWRGEYDISDSKLRAFVEFFNLYWSVLQEHPQKKLGPLHIALPRFSSSYDKRTLSERLIELMIAMEAMFSDREYNTYKIPLRCACLLFPPGEARKRTFKRVKELYDARSRILHGEHLETIHTSKDIRTFEDLARKSILKFMQYHLNGRQITSGSELDDLLFFSAH